MPCKYGLPIAGREALAWIVREQRTAFPSTGPARPRSSNRATSCSSTRRAAASETPHAIAVAIRNLDCEIVVSAIDVEQEPSDVLAQVEALAAQVARDATLAAGPRSKWRTSG
jgi:hypothetical protein